MKYSIITTAVAFLFAFSAKAQVQFSTKAVVGLIGSSYATCKAPENSPLQGVGLAGCSYEGLDIALLKSPLLKSMTVQSTALGGAFSFDIPGTGWQGFATQFQRLAVRTSWADGVPRLKHLVLDLPNDCLHSQPCTEQSYEAITLAIYQGVISQAQAMGVKVYVTGLPNYSDLNLPLAAAVYGLQNVIGAELYAQLQKKHEEVLSALPGVVYIKPYAKKFSTFDGLHPDEPSMKHAAHVIAKAIKKNK